jgi:hypothetical protein
VIDHWDRDHRPAIDSGRQPDSQQTLRTWVFPKGTIESLAIIPCVFSALTTSLASCSADQARDSMFGLMKTCQKLGLSFWYYLGDRLGMGDDDHPIPPSLPSS